MPEELESAGLIAGQQLQIFDDPFSMEFLEKAEKTIEVSAIHAPKVKRARKVLTDKFIMHKDLKRRLLKLKSTDVPQIVKDIVDDLLSLKRVPEGSKYCNYLGLSQADYSKLSYLDEDRKNRLEGQETRMHMIRPGAIIVLHVGRTRLYGDSTPVFTKRLTLTARHLNNLVYPIREFYEKKGSYSAHRYTGPGDGRDEEVSYAYNVPRLEQESELLRIRHSITYGINNFFIDQAGLTITSSYPNILGVEFENTEVALPEVWNYKQRYHTSVGKLIRRIFKDKYSDRDITAFSEAYASLVTVSNPLYDFKIIEGQEIKWGYHEDNYQAHTNSLGSSCMRYERCQDYLEIYTRYPSKVKMGVLLKGNKVAARSILWNLGDKWAYDRIYSTKTETENLLKSALESANYIGIWQKSGQYSIKIDLSGISQFPYVDTLYCYHPDDQLLSNYGEGHHYTFRCTGGSYYNNSGSPDTINCIVCDTEIEYDESYHIDAGRYRDERCCGDCSIYSEVMDANFTDRDDFVQDYNSDPVLRSRAVELFDGDYAYVDDPALRQYENNFGFFIHNEHNYEEIDGDFYHPDDENKPEADTSIEVVTETTQDFSFTRDTETPYILTSPSSVSNSLSTFSSSGSSIVYHPSQFSGYLEMPTTLGDIARTLGEAIEVDENNLTIESLAEAVEQLSQHLPTEPQTTEGPDQFLI
jgi:hypothetical protein